MEKINTPLQLALKEISDYKKKEPDNDDYHRGIRSGLSISIDLIKRFKETERLYMEKAHEKGCTDSMPDGYVITLPDSRNIKQCFEDYFTQTFKSYE